MFWGNLPDTVGGGLWLLLLLLLLDICVDFFLLFTGTRELLEEEWALLERSAVVAELVAGLLEEVASVVRPAVAVEAEVLLRLQYDMSRRTILQLEVIELLGEGMQSLPANCVGPIGLCDQILLQFRGDRIQKFIGTRELLVQIWFDYHR